MPSASTEINNLKSYTAMHSAKTDTVTGAASQKLNQADFLKLLTEQLQYQDPMEPMDNSQFVSQINQFSQLETQTAISTDLASSSAVQQAMSLVGQTVVIKDPDNAGKTISGKVQAAYIDGAKSAITINGKNYPLSSMLYAISPETAAAKEAADKAAADAAAAANNGSGTGSGTGTGTGTGTSGNTPVTG